MKRMFSILLFLVLLISTVNAVDLDKEDSTLGDPDYHKVNDMGFFDKLQLALSGGQGLTVVNEAVCSRNPDESYEFTHQDSNDLVVCRENTDHIGEAYQLFEVKDDGSWNFIGEKKIPEGGVRCFGVEVGQKYHVSVFYCDDLVERTCTDSDGGENYYTSGTVTFDIEGDDKSSEVYLDECDGDTLLERKCDSDNSPSTFSKVCSEGCSNGACIEDTSPDTSPDDTTTTPEEEVDIDLSNVKVTNDGNLVEGQTYKVSGVAEVIGKCDGCVIETGFEYYGTPLTITMESSEGACRADDTVGVKFTSDNEYVEYSLYDKATSTGRYKVRVLAYNGCYEDMGDNLKLLDSKTFTLNVEESPSEEEQQEEQQEESNETVTNVVELSCYLCRGNDTVETSIQTEVTTEEAQTLSSGTESAKSLIRDSYCPSGTSGTLLNCSLPEDREEVDFCKNNPESPACVPNGGPIENVTEDRKDYYDGLTGQIDATYYILIGVGVAFIVVLAIILYGGNSKRRLL